MKRKNIQSRRQPRPDDVALIIHTVAMKHKNGLLGTIFIRVGIEDEPQVEINFETNNPQNPKEQDMTLILKGEKEPMLRCLGGLIPREQRTPRERSLLIVCGPPTFVAYNMAQALDGPDGEFFICPSDPEAFLRIRLPRKDWLELQPVLLPGFSP